MKDLEQATGVGREAIRFYIREGLLPEPERPAKNVAYYDASFVEKIRFIKELQEKRYLPLHVIRRIVANDGEPTAAEVEALLELDGKLFPSVKEAPRLEPVEIGEAARRSGVPLDEVHVVAGTGAITLTERDGQEWIEGSGLELLDLWGQLRASGFTPEQGFAPEDIGLYVDMVEWLAREELRLFTRGVAGRVKGADAVAMAEQGIDVLNKILGLLRKNTLLKFIAEGNVPESKPKRRPRGRRRKE